MTLNNKYNDHNVISDVSHLVITLSYL